MRGAIHRAAGHVRTALAELRGTLAPPPGPPATAFEVVLHDPVMGDVRLRGLFGGPRDSDTIVVITPGLTGTATSWYCAHAAWAVERAGFAHLRIGMRGTDRSGEDIWHGGLTDDLRATLGHAALARFARILLIGYSVGGHVSLCAAAEQIDQRVRAVTAICPPLDLELGTVFFDQPERRPYRIAINAALNEIYAATAQRRSLPVSLARVRAARSSRERDALAIAPRFGFRSAEDYYTRASVAPRLSTIRVPTLIVAGLDDPVVPPRAIAPAIASAGRAVTVHWRRGGHIAFPEPVESAALAWMTAQGG
jgi:predicted alpha/beta-fold hydrolase